MVNTMTNIQGKSIATVSQMQAYIKRVNPNISKSVINMIPHYISEGEAEGIRGDIAFSQSCLETGNFTFSGSAVTLDQNNFAGLGVTQLGMRGNSWDSPQIGIRAQIQHLKAYATNSPLNQECVDNRYKYVPKGCSPYVDWLGIQENPQHVGWASGKNYGTKILNILKAILNEDLKESQKGDTPMKINVHAGHNYNVPGASGYLNETKEARIVKDEVIRQLKELGHTVYDCTDENATSSNGNLAAIVSKCNAHDVDLDVSIHFNAGVNDSGNGYTTGTEVWIYSPASKASTYADNVAKQIASLGYKNRGVKVSTGLYVLKHSNSPAMLIECCFVDDKDDVNIYDANKMASAIVKGITGKNALNTNNSNTLNTSNSGSDIEIGNNWLTATKDKLPLYTEAGGTKVNKTVNKNTRIRCFARKRVNGVCYFHCGDGWADGRYLTGWIKENNKWWYLLEGYKYPTNKWMEINGNKYYFDTNGYMLEDTLVRVDEQVYYVDKNGKLCFTDSTGALK